MKSILPNGQNGIRIADLPRPELLENAVLCRATYSLISTGTERMMIGNCAGWTDEQILERGVRLGYTGAGVVEDVRGTSIGVSPGQRVAYYGSPYVSHSEYVVVPRNLVFPVPDALSSPEAAWIGVGAIALHGFRKGRLSLGETCFVLGAGNIGNLCAQLAITAGCRVVVSDYNEERLAILRECVGNAPDFVTVSPDGAAAAIQALSGSLGADAALVAASASSSEPMEQAMNAVIPGGRIVVVGVFDIAFSRPAFFDKEAEVTISRAGGPGRYDPTYERDGIDYPPQYSRWTEGRNLEAVLRLLADGRIRVAPLISESFSVDHAAEAYARVMEGTDRIGCILKW
jgi:threonine dehydrogenase-like Zn-dependent dehydrogenase